MYSFSDHINFFPKHAGFPIITGKILRVQKAFNGDTLYSVRSDRTGVIHPIYKSDYETYRVAEMA